MESKVVDKVYLYTACQAVHCRSPEAARILYLRAKSILGAKTRVLCKPEGIDIEDILPDSIHSSKAVLQSVIHHGVPSVFKFPFTDEYRDSVEQDYLFCERLSEANNGVLPEGMVRYRQHSLTNSRSVVVTGSISKRYLLSINTLNRPLSMEFICKTVRRVKATLTEVHALGFTINDLKPANLFMDCDGNVDIGDFGGALGTLDYLEETTRGYIPEDILARGRSCPAVDWMCLINSVFMLLDEPGGTTTSDIALAVAELSLDTAAAVSNELRDLLHEILSLAQKKSNTYRHWHEEI